MVLRARSGHLTVLVRFTGGGGNGKVGSADKAAFAKPLPSSNPWSMVADLSADLVWSLRALAQNADDQHNLFPSFVLVTDELVESFGDAYDLYIESTQIQHADLDDLYAHILSKSGVLEFWTDEALDQSEFWEEIRSRAKQALAERNLATFAPHPSPLTYISSSEVWSSGRRIEKPQDTTPNSFLSKLLSLFR